MRTQSTILRPPETTGTADPGKLLAILENETARSILGSMGDRSVTAGELADHCGIPISTMYRQLGALEGVGLVEKTIRIHPSGHHAAQYVRTVSSLSVSFGADGDLTVVLE